MSSRFYVRMPSRRTSRRGAPILGSGENAPTAPSVAATADLPAAAAAVVSGQLAAVVVSSGPVPIANANVSAGVPVPGGLAQVSLSNGPSLLPLTNGLAVPSGGPTPAVPLIVVPTIPPGELMADVLLQEDSATASIFPRLAAMAVQLYCYPGSAVSCAGNLLLGK